MKQLFLAILFACSLLMELACDSKKTGTDAVGTPSGPVLFEKMAPQHTGIDFVNAVAETPLLNYLTFNYIYMSGSVGVGDFNRDGLEDLYGVATSGANKLYLNKGNFQFEEAGARAGVQAADGVKTGVAVVDINGDGWLDIYQCRTGLVPQSRGNLLFINNGGSGSWSGGFTERSAEYGLNTPCSSTHANFFDFDRDGDLDMYLLNHRTDFRNTSQIRAKKEGDKIVHITTSDDEWSSDRLYRNEGNGKFTDISKQAGIQNYSFGLSATIIDANRDGWPDVFVANDYVEPDNLFINNKNGTFTDRIEEHLRHTSNFSMGVDWADINNDALPDLVSLDMALDGNYRQKIMATSMVPDRYNTSVAYGYGHQMMRNMLQLNNGDGSFSEIGCLAGVSASDWSWAPLLADFDNDGYRDLFISNGQRRDMNNLDYMTYDLDSVVRAGGNAATFMNATPPVEVHNYCYRNKGDLSFDDVSVHWGFAEKTLSNSAVYADLDNDGDQDIIVINSFKPAFVYKNKTVETGAGNYLEMLLEGPARNTAGLGAALLLETGSQRQYAEATPLRGFLSASTSVVHFGLGKTAAAEKLHIQWPDGKVQTLENVTANQRITLKYADAKAGPPILKNMAAASKPLFTDITQQAGILYKHEENVFNDFNRERLIPHSFSNQGPSLAVADVNGDGLDDFYAGTCFLRKGVLGIQQKNGKFSTNSTPFPQDTLFEDTDALFFDANGDKAPDLFVVSGGNEAPLNSKYYQDRLYLNDGKGNFKYAPDNIPKESESGGCVAAYDYDRDGDLDLFVGGRVVPGAYPRMPFSSVLQNDGAGRFSNVTNSVAPELSQIGLVTAILFADLDKDGQDEMIVTGEWMALEVTAEKEIRPLYSLRECDDGRCVPEKRTGNGPAVQSQRIALLLV